MSTHVGALIEFAVLWAWLLVGCWTVFSLLNGRKPTTSEVTFWAVSSALLVLAFFVHATYVYSFARSWYGSTALIIPALVVFAAIFGAHVLKNRPDPVWVLVALAVSGILLWFLGMYTWAFVACGMRDCL